MIWADYNIESLSDGTWRVEKEAFDKGLYKANDIFIVDEKGWLVKIDDLTVLMKVYEKRKNDKTD